jgi:hypothetical protein
MNEIENLLILLREDIEGSHCWLEPVLAINDGEQFVKCYQCDDWIMYDIYNSDPRDDTEDEDSEVVDGWCLVNTKEDMNIDFFGILSKLEFIGKAHLPIEQWPPLYASCRYVDWSGGITADQTFHLSLEYQNSQLEEMILNDMNYHAWSDLIDKYLAHHNYDEPLEVNPFGWDETLSYWKNSNGWIYFYYYNGDDSYYHFQVFKVEPGTYLDLHF